MTRIAKISHVPIQEPMYMGGVMTVAWVRFFEQLAKGVDVAEFADLITMHAKSHELPTSAVMGQMMIDNVPDFDTVQTPSIDNVTLTQVQLPTQELT